MIVKMQKPIELVNTCDALYDVTLLEAAIVWYSPRPVARLKKIFMYGNYPAVAIHKDKVHIHRLVMMYSQDDKTLGGKYVDHIDGNKLDSRPHNLRLLTPSEHQSITNKGRRQTPEHIAKRTDTTTRTRYGHSIYENPELLKENSNV